MEGIHEFCLLLLVICQIGLLMPIAKARSLATSDHISLLETSTPSTELRPLQSSTREINAAVSLQNADGIDSSQSSINLVTTPAVALSPSTAEQNQEVSSSTMLPHDPLSTAVTKQQQQLYPSQQPAKPSISDDDFVEVLSRQSSHDNSDEKSEQFTRDRLQREIVRSLQLIQNMGNQRDGHQGGDMDASSVTLTTPQQPMTNAHGDRRQPSFRKVASSKNDNDAHHPRLHPRHPHLKHHESASSSNENSKESSEDSDDSDDNSSSTSNSASSDHDNSDKSSSASDSASSDDDDDDSDITAAATTTTTTTTTTNTNVNQNKVSTQPTHKQRPHHNHNHKTPAPPSGQSARSMENTGDGDDEDSDDIPAAWKAQMNQMTLQELMKVVAAIQAAYAEGCDSDGFITIGTIHVTITQITRIKISDICCAV